VHRLRQAIALACQRLKVVAFAAFAAFRWLCLASSCRQPEVAVVVACPQLRVVAVIAYGQVVSPELSFRLLEVAAVIACRQVEAVAVVACRLTEADAFQLL